MICDRSLFGGRLAMVLGDGWNPRRLLGFLPAGRATIGLPSQMTEPSALAGGKYAALGEWQPGCREGNKGGA